MNPHISQLISDGLLQDAISELDAIISCEPGNHDAIFTRGKLYWRLGNQAAATADYTRAADLQPDGPAVRALENTQDIIDFFNPDIFNP